MEIKKLMASAVNRCAKPKNDIPRPANNGPKRCEIWPEITIDELATGNSSHVTICGIKQSLAG